MTAPSVAGGGLCFEPTDEQRLLRSTVREFVEREFPKLVARDLEQRRGEFPWELWRALGAAGLHGVGISEEHGGEGGDLIDQALVAEELARSLAGLVWPWALGSRLAAHALSACGSGRQRETLLAEIADGRSICGLALGAARSGHGGGAERIRARDLDGGFSISGASTFVVGADVAARLLVVAHVDGHSPAAETLFLCDPSAPGVTISVLETLGSAALGSCAVTFDGARVAREDVVGEVGAAATVLAELRVRECVMTGALCCGILAGVLEDALQYAREREAFGKPIGQFQSIQHGVAEIQMNLETARLHTYQAAWLAREGLPCEFEANAAKCLASELAVSSADFGIQLFGGYGYATEYNMQRYWRDARMLRIVPVTTELGREAIGDWLGLPRWN